MSNALVNWNRLLSKLTEQSKNGGLIFVKIRRHVQTR